MVTVSGAKLYEVRTDSSVDSFKNGQKKTTRLGGFVERVAVQDGGVFSLRRLLGGELH